MKKILMIFVIILLLVMAAFLYYKEGSLPVNKNSTENQIFVVTQGEALNSIAKNLEKQGLIRNKIVFYAIVKQLGIERSIQAGDFRLSPSMDAFSIANNLTHGTLDVWVTLIEGTRVEEMAQIIAKNFNVPETEFIKLAVEGYMFPDTYLIPRGATANMITKILSDNFNSKFTFAMKEKAAKTSGLSPKEVIIIASMVEKEARLEKDRPKVAGIIIKRLKNDWPLQIDATIQYALGYQSQEKSWWKKHLTIDDLKIDSPYNTYENPGLPPGPICNPGLSSINAVVNADIESDYMYYLSDKSGNMHYGKTLEEHNANVRKYLQ